MSWEFDYLSIEGFKDRLVELMDAAGDRQNLSAFARKCGLAESLIRKYVGGSVPSADRAAQIAERNGVSLLWLVTGEGHKFDQEVISRPAEPARTDPELFGRVFERIDKLYVEESVHIPRIELGRLAAEQYDLVKDQAADAEEWPALLELMTVRLRRSLRASVADPANVKREA